MVKVIVAKQKHDMTHMLGQFPDESHYDHLIEEDTDVYMPEIPGHPEMTFSEERIVLKFRKNYFSKEQQDQAYIGLREAATETQNRGMAAGPRAEKLGNREWVTEYEYAVIDYFTNPGANLYGDDPIETIRAEFKNKKEAPSTRNNVWGIQAVKRDNFVFEDWVNATKNLSNDDMIAEAKRISDKQKFAMSFPFLQQLAQGFKDLLPWRYNNQMEAAKKLDPRFLVPGTPFTTITVNKSFRTACHFDAGDFTAGLSNLLTLTNNGNYRGCHLVAPEYRVAVNPRPGDLLLINNHEVMHGNTQIELLDDVAERISLVVYFREKMLELGSKEYEDCRYEYVESRRLNKEHPGHVGRNLWNGIDAGMWESEEWHTYLESKLGTEVLHKYHPPKTTTVGALEEFFG